MRPEEIERLRAAKYGTVSTCYLSSRVPVGVPVGCVTVRTNVFAFWPELVHEIEPELELLFVCSMRVGCAGQQTTGDTRVLAEQL